MTNSPMFWAITLAPLVLFLGVITFGIVRKNKYDHKGWAERLAEAIETRDIQTYWELAQAKRIFLSLCLPWAANIIWRSFMPVTLSANGQPTLASSVLNGLLVCVAITSFYLVISALYQLVIGWRQASETEYAQRLQKKLEHFSRKESASPFDQNGARKIK